MTNQKAAEVLDYLNIQTAIYLAELLGWDSLYPQDQEILQANGYDKKDFEKKEPFLDIQYRYGNFTGLLLYGGKAKELAQATQQQVSQAAQKPGLPYPQSKTPLFQQIKNQAANDIKRLNAQLFSSIQNIVSQAETKAIGTLPNNVQAEYYAGVISDAAVITAVSGKTRRFFTTLMGEATKDYARDYDRIGDYIMNTAFQVGVADQMEFLSGGDSAVMYYKIPSSGACKICVKLYLKDGLGSEPILYSLQELRDNGDNIGRKSSEMKPVIGSTHPFCRCQLNSVDTDLYEWREGRWALKKNSVKKKEKLGITVTLGEKKIEL